MLIRQKSALKYSLEGLMLKLQYFGHLMRRANSLEKTLMLGKIEGRRRKGNRGWDVWMASLTQWTCVWISSRSWWWTGKPGMLQSMGLQRVRHNWVTKQQQHPQKFSPAAFIISYTLPIHSTISRQPPIYFFVTILEFYTNKEIFLLLIDLYHNYFGIFIHVIVYVIKSFISFDCWVIIHCMNTAWFSYAFFH